MAYVYIDDDASKHKFSSFIIAVEPQRIDSHTRRKEIISLIPLEEEVDALVEFIPKIYDKVRLAKQNSKNPSNGLSCDESAATYLLTMRWKPDDECFCSVLNANLRHRNPQQLKPWNLYLQLLFTALSHLPSTKITFYRQIEHDLIENYLKENFFIFWDFILCSLSVASGKSSLHDHPTTKKTISALECCNAKFIERHSHDYSKK